jgi:hypothetical protein
LNIALGRITIVLNHRTLFLSTELSLAYDKWISQQKRNSRDRHYRQVYRKDEEKLARIREKGRERQRRYMERKKQMAQFYRDNQ